MHSEHISNLHPGWVVGGWLVGVAVSSAGFMVLVGVGLLRPDSGASAFLVPLAVAVGFYVGGLFVGLRWVDAPILHGAAMTFLSVLVWFLGEVVAPRLIEPRLGPSTGGSRFVLGMILLQLVVTIAGGWTGRWMMLRGAAPATEG
jgi:hypothetical protein